MVVRIIVGDAREKLKLLPDESVHCIVTSPPYWGLRDYGVAGQIGLEESFEDWLDIMIDLFDEARRVLRSDGVAWVNLGDCYANDGKWGGATGGKHTKYLHGGETRIGREKRRSGLKPKDLVGMPWRFALAAREAGWWLRRDIVWHKQNPLPENVSDRPTCTHEFIFLLSKNGGNPLLYRAKDTREWKKSPDFSEVVFDEEGKESPRWRGFDYFYDADAIAEPVSPNTHARVSQDVANQVGSTRANAGGKTNGNMKAVVKSPKIREPDSGNRNNQSFVDATAGHILTTRNKRTVWTTATEAYTEAHFATFPPALIEPCILAGCPIGGTVLDPFGGAGTTGLVADRLQRNAILIELNPAYAKMADRRIHADGPLFASTEKEF